MATEADVKRAVEEYCKLHSLPLFKITDPVDIQLSYRENTPFSPGQDGAGCYLFWSGNKELLYIGKVSWKNKLVARIMQYFNWDQERTAVITKQNHRWTSPPVYVSTIGVQIPYQAPSLEEYLIGALKPPNNTIGALPVPPNPTPDSPP
jgi:hypothetical protein